MNASPLLERRADHDSAVAKDGLRTTDRACDSRICKNLPKMETKVPPANGYVHVRVENKKAEGIH